MIDVCMPWRAQPARLPAFEHVTAWWREHGYRVVLGDSHHQPFNRAAARNAAARKATGDVLVFSDADTIPDLLAVDTAITAARRHGGVWWPFTEYRYLAATVQPGDNLASAAAEEIYPASVGGTLVVRRDVFAELGGFDERFREWGGEDRAFELAAAALATVNRIPAVAYAFNHPADRNMRGPWRTLLQEYRIAYRRQRMREYLDSRA